MARVHLFELHELAWFPAAWRDLLTDYLSFYAQVFNPYLRVAPLLAEAFGDVRCPAILDLCSGAGRPVLSLIPALRRLGVEGLRVTLTDKFPNLAAIDAHPFDGATVAYCSEPVDATDVPTALSGFRTLFTSFHHFRPDAARSILANAIASGEGIGVFEYTERNWIIWAVPTLLIPAFIWLATPFMRPFRWRRLLWTYLLPVVPLVALWDGFVSCLRTYSIAELGKLVDSVDRWRYEWKIGRVRSVGCSRVTYAIGVPRWRISSNAGAGATAPAVKG
jgi:hypothetical protein